MKKLKEIYDFLRNNLPFIGTMLAILEFCFGREAIVDAINQGSVTLLTFIIIQTPLALFAIFTFIGYLIRTNFLRSKISWKHVIQFLPGTFIAGFTISWGLRLSHLIITGEFWPGQTQEDIGWMLLMSSIALVWVGFLALNEAFKEKVI